MTDEADDVATELIALETALARRDPGVDLEALVHPDFAAVGASGRRWDRASVVELLAAGTGAVVTLEDVEVARLAPGVALVTFRTIEPGRVALRASVWVRDEGRWRIRYHQGTRIR